MFTKLDAIKVICNAAKTYHKKLANRNFLIIYKNRSNNAIENFEALFLPRNFLHLTGLSYINPKNSSDFYTKCLSNNLSENDFTFKEDGTTDLKLKALPQIVNFSKMSKMTTIYSNTQPRLYTERIAGNVTACIGFVVDNNNGYYVPNTCLFQDIRTLGMQANQILAVLSKPASKEFSLYSTVEYRAKGFRFRTVQTVKRIGNSILCCESTHQKQLSLLLVLIFNILWHCYAKMSVCLL